MSKYLVAYFSATGTTRGVAKDIARAAGADLFEIQPVTPYTRADLDWTNPNSRSSREMNNLQDCPPICGVPQNMDQYTTVFVGFPIWWYTIPTVVCTFLRDCQLDGKTVVLFATSGGSGMGNCAQLAAKLCLGAHIKEAKLLNHVPDHQLNSWINSILKQG